MIHSIILIKKSYKTHVEDLENADKEISEYLKETKLYHENL